MGNPAIFSGKRTKLLSTKGILNSDLSIVDNDGIPNYIKNGHAEINTLGWATYADAAGVLPIDGTGGTPTHITFTQTTTSPLGGLGSFLITNSGSTSAQGEGASYNFTIDAKDQAKVLQISFDYLINSGTFTAGSSTTDSDLEVYIYDITNAVIIQPSSYKLLSSSSTIADKFLGTFQTASNSTSYRLILHCPTTATSAWSLKLDNIAVSPSQYVFGSPITDWQQGYTPILTNAGNATATGKYRKFGDSMQVQVRITIGSTVPTGIFLFSPPPGYSIDTNKIIGTDLASVIGSGEIVKAGVGYNLQVLYSSTTALFFAYQSALTGAQTGVNATAPVALAAGDIVTGTVTFPVLGWSSSVQMSDSSNQQAITARLTSGSTSVASATATKLNITTATEDSAGGFSASNSRYIIQVSGYYTFQGEFSYTVPTNTGFRSACRIYKNGLQISDSSYVYPINQLGNSSVVSISTPSFQCNAGDYIELYGYQESASTVTALTQYLSIQKVTGPSSIAATESISACYYDNNTGAVVTTGGSVFKPATKEWDTHGSFNTTTGEYTCNIAGEWFVDCGVILATQSRAAGNATFIGVLVNGTLKKYIATTRMSATATQTQETAGGGSVKCLAGDKITVGIYADTATSLFTPFSPVGSMNYIQIKRVGN